MYDKKQLFPSSIIRKTGKCTPRRVAREKEQKDKKNETIWVVIPVAQLKIFIADAIIFQSLAPSSTKTTTTTTATTKPARKKLPASSLTTISTSTTTTTTVTTAASSPSSSRAPSLCSDKNGVTTTASSGYESSSRSSSHLGPHFEENNMPRANSPEPRYNTLKPRRRKLRQHAAQFYSLRICRKHHEHTHHCHYHHHLLHHHSGRLHHPHRDRPSLQEFCQQFGTTRRGSTGSLQMYAVPILRTSSCKHSLSKSASNSTSTLATTLPRSAESTPTSSRKFDLSSLETEEELPPPLPPPIPAPRATKKTDPSEHTYQNVSPKVNKDAMTSTDSFLDVCRPLILLTTPPQSRLEKIDIADFNRGGESSKRGSAILFSTSYCSTLENGDQLDLYAQTMRLKLLPKSHNNKDH